MQNCITTLQHNATPEGDLREPTGLARRIKLYAALLMFQSQELSAGAAAELAEVDRFTFAVECRKHGIPLVDYPAEDLREELAGLRPTAP